MTNNIVLLGSQWGDEGKGKIVDLLSQEADAVVRFQGGHNAGHTLVVGDKKTVLHLLPSAVMHAHAQCLIGNGVVVNLAQLLKEMDTLDAAGVSLRERLRLSYACPLLLPHHIALDIAREKARGKNAIGTTGRGIGPAYEDKIARRGLRLGDLLQPESFAENLRQVMDYHNHALQHFFAAKPLDYAQTLDTLRAQAERVVGLLDDVAAILHQLRRENKKVIFEGAQGMLLDIDHGTYPFVTSSNTTAATAATGSGIGPLDLDYVLGITKAYTTRVGAGPFPSELRDAVGSQIAERGHEFGATTGRARRCGWLDAVALRRSCQVNGLSALCVTKLDVLDQLARVKICVGYRYRSERVELPPYGAEALAQCEPEYETLDGWQQSTRSIRHYHELPENAKIYLQRMQTLSGLPIDIISTGAERNDTIIVNHPFQRELPLDSTTQRNFQLD